jgi:membrane fusion protein (multidrug efflux system)
MLEISDEKEPKREPRKKNPSTRSSLKVSAANMKPLDLHDHEAQTNQTNANPPLTRPLYKRPAVVILASLMLVILASVGTRYLLYASSHESTDDAFVEGHVIQISSKASGYVTKVYVDDNQQVKAGDLIVELDERDYEARLQQAKAALEAGLAKQNEARTNLILTRATSNAAVQQASAMVRRARSVVESSRAGAAGLESRANQATTAISTAEANLAQARAQVLAAEAEATRANADVERYKILFAKDEISRQQLDQAVATSDKASAQLDASRQRALAAAALINEARSAKDAASENARQAQSQTTGAEAGVSEALGRLAQANTAPEQVAVSQAQSQTADATTEQLRSAVALADLELSYTKIYASEAGRITRKSVEEGALVQIGQPLLAIVPGDVWVTGNFKESQIGRMVIGQPVDIRVDAYPDKIFKGHVDSIQAGTGARFSLIPPENATGNYVKVVQRVPIKIVFDEPPDPKHMLAPGMSVVPQVAVK